MNHKAPFFILANPRSGSSLFRIICDCNKQLSVPPESGFLLWWKDKYEHLSEKDLEDSEILNSILDDILISKKIETWGLNREELFLFILSHHPKSYSELGSLIYYFQAEMRGKKPTYWGDKNNYYIHHLEELISLYPNAKFIHLLRDGRDVACSYKNIKNVNSKSPYFPLLTDKTEDIAKEWVDNNQKIYEFLKKVKVENALQIHFEDVVMHMKETSEKVCSFLKVDYDATMLRYFKINSKNIVEPSETLDWKKKTLQRPDKDKIGYYKQQLSAQEINSFHKFALKTLNMFGYE